MPRTELWPEQLNAARRAVIARPGSTAYQVSLSVPPDPPQVGELFRRGTAMTLVLALLRELEVNGEVYSKPDVKGRQWYPVPAGEAERERSTR
jgi:hypothetical protein